MERNEQGRFFGPDEVEKSRFFRPSSYLPFLSQEKRLRERKNLDTLILQLTRIKTALLSTHGENE